MNDMTDNAKELLGEAAKRMYQIEGCGDHIRVDFHTGSDITRCSEDAVTSAEIMRMPVHFSFNGVECKALADSEPSEIVDHYRKMLDDQAEAYRNPPEGKKRAAEREREIIAKQSRVDVMQAELPSIAGDQTKLVAWLGEFSGLNDDIDVKIDRVMILATLEGAGYEQNQNVGDPEVQTDLEKMAGYLAGQAIDCLKGRVGKIHPTMIKFAQEYADLVASSNTITTGWAIDDDGTVRGEERG